MVRPRAGDCCQSHSNRDKMSISNGTTRQEHLEHLGAFLQNLHRTLGTVFPLECQAGDLIRTQVSGECVQCGLRVSGEELLAMLREQPSAKAGKVVRLCQGYCGRRGCNSYYYRIDFSEEQSFDWPKVLAAMDSGQSVALQNAWAPTVPTARPRRWGRWATRAVALLASILSLLIAWQWHRGGTIPFLREGEHFQVDSLRFEE